MGDLSGEKVVTRAGLLLAESRRDIPVLEAAIASPDPSHRTLALGALDRLDALTDPMLIDAMFDAAVIVRCRALELAVSRPGVELVDMVSDVDDLVVESACWALGERGESSDRVIDALRTTAFEHEVSICREAAIAALGALGSRRGLDAILHGLSDRAPVRRRAVLALAPFDGPRVHEALTRALDDRDRQVRQAAEDLL